MFAGQGLEQQVLGISRSRKLYLGERLLAEGCTSAAVRAEGPGGPSLLFITSDNVLHTLPLSRLQEGMLLTGDKPVAERCSKHASFSLLFQLKDLYDCFAWHSPGAGA